MREIYLRGRGHAGLLSQDSVRPLSLTALR